MTHIYRTDHRTDGPNRSGPISVLLKSVLGSVLGPDRGPNGPDQTVNIPTDDHCSELPSLGLVIQYIPLNKYCTPFRLAISD